MLPRISYKERRADHLISRFSNGDALSLHNGPQTWSRMSSSCERDVKTPLYPVVMMSASAPEVKSDFERCRVLVSRRVACANIYSIKLYFYLKFNRT